VDFTARVRVRFIVKMTVFAVIAVATSNIKLRFNAGDGWPGPDYQCPPLASADTTGQEPAASARLR
jgi:hypothetical protein